MMLGVVEHVIAHSEGFVISTSGECVRGDPLVTSECEGLRRGTVSPLCRLDLCVVYEICAVSSDTSFAKKTSYDEWVD